MIAVVVVVVAAAAADNDDDDDDGDAADDALKCSNVNINGSLHFKWFQITFPFSPFFFFAPLFFYLINSLKAKMYMYNNRAVIGTIYLLTECTRHLIKFKRKSFCFLSIYS